MKEKYLKIFAFRTALLLSIVAFLLVIAEAYITINLFKFLLIFVFFVIAYVIFFKTLMKIEIYLSKEYKKNLKKLQKNIKQENLEELKIKQNKEIAQLKANEKFRKEYIGNVAHELKTPIFNIQGYITTLLDGALNDTNVNIKYLERTEKNSQRLITIVKDLDIISKLETGTIKLNFQNFDLVPIIFEVMDILENFTQEYGINLIFNHNKPIIVYADVEKITEVVHNLALNSIIYGIINGKTEIKIQEKKKKVFVSVQDNGIGISEKDISHIFERFFRVDKSRSRERGGSGLGLSIVKHIIDTHNQTITVKSKVGEGTTFTFSLQKGTKE